jgi:mannose-6-phosphate isomerase-like protein (cupin superfamily)
MSAYTKINFMEIEPSGFTGEGRFSRKYLDSKELGMSYWKYPANFKATKAHSHKQQEEVYVVIGGSGQMLLDGKVEDLKQWDVIRVAPETVRAFAAGPEGLEVIIAGGQKPEGGDGVMAETNWPS